MERLIASHITIDRNDDGTFCVTAEQNDIVRRYPRASIELNIEVYPSSKEEQILFAFEVNE